MDIDQISKEFGNNVKLNEIKVTVTLSQASLETNNVIANGATRLNAAILVPAVDYELKATYNNKPVEINSFNQFVTREIPLPDGTTINKITTGVVLKSDGSLAQVPTRVFQKNNIYYAEVNSLTNSTYSVVWNIKEFEDTHNHWAQVDINDFASRLIAKGTTEQTFEPDRHVTRAEFASLVVRALGITKGGTEVSFTDVDKQNILHSEIIIANAYGLIRGYDDGTFKPNAAISRQEAIVILTRAMKLAQLETSIDEQTANALLGTFKDSNQIRSWSKDAISISIKLGLLKGFNQYLHLNDNITRAESIVIIRRLLQSANLI